MRTVGEQKIPQMKHLRKRRGTSTERQHRRKRVQFCLHPFSGQVSSQFWIDHLETFIHQSKTLVYPIHGPSHVTGTLPGDEVMEQGKRFDLTARRVQERGTQDVHPLHVRGTFAQIRCWGFIHPQHPAPLFDLPRRPKCSPPLR